MLEKKELLLPKHYEQIQAIFKEYQKVIVAQEDLLTKMLIALFVGGHVLLEGVPGLAKTMAIKTFSKILDLDFTRIQFTSDLLPSDILGVEVYNQKTGEFYLKKGPLFSQVVLADEINRAPSKVQSALLEAMEEKQITIGDKTFFLNQPYIVMATQNPMEQEGTYPLPEAQMDRFMLKVTLDYVSQEEEKEIIKRAFSLDFKSVRKILSSKDIIFFRTLVRNLYIDERLIDYIINIVYATRFPQTVGIDSSFITYGASPRASVYLTYAAKAFAFIQGESFVTTEDVKSIALDVLRHRITLSYEAEAQGIKTEDMIKTILDTVKTP